MSSLEDSIFSSDDATFQYPDEECFLRHIPEYDNFRSFIDYDKLKAEVEKDGVHGLNRYITGQFTDWTDKELVVGITGATGTGKSSLINALRGLKARDKGAAPVGVTETTKDIQSYKYPGNEKVILKDFPGVGTQNFPKDKYIQQTKILDSCVVIIVSASRFTEFDVWLAKQVIDVRKNVLFVRSKTDIDINNMENDDPDFTEFTCMDKIKTDMEENLKQGKLDQQILSDAIFLVSSRHGTKYDFPSLERKLMSLQRMKAEAICHHLYQHMEATVTEKTDKMKTNSFVKFTTALTGVLQAKYCLDKASITRFSKEVDMPEHEIESRLKSFDERVVDGHHLYANFEDKMYLFVQKYSKYTGMPGLGLIYSAFMSPNTIRECVDKVCDIMAKDELLLVRLRLNKLETDVKT